MSETGNVETWKKRRERQRNKKITLTIRSLVLNSAPSLTFSIYRWITHYSSLPSNMDYASYFHSLSFTRILDTHGDNKWCRNLIHNWASHHLLVLKAAQSCCYLPMHDIVMYKDRGNCHLYHKCCQVELQYCSQGIPECPKCGKRQELDLGILCTERMLLPAAAFFQLQFFVPNCPSF